MKFYRVEIITADNKKHIEFTSGEDEIEAIDKVVEKYKNKEILDVKVV
jgi:hypothetical protein